MFELLGLKSRPAFINYPSGNATSKDFGGEQQSGGCGGSGGCGSGAHAHAHA